LVNKGVTVLSCGTYSSFAITAGGQLYAWGKNKTGNLGLGLSQDIRVPTLVEGKLKGKHVTAVAPGALKFGYLLLSSHVLSNVSLETYFC
jgi:regulator of chromosome condensation